MTVRDFINEGKEKLKDVYPLQESLVLVRTLLQAALQWPFVKIVTEDHFELSDEMSSVLMQQLNRLSSSEPVQYILGYTQFCGITIGVSPMVLIPRPETEELLQFIADDHFESGSELLDVGTGSGCIAIVLKKQYPECHVTGCDVSFEALLQAKSNAVENDVQINWRWIDVVDNKWDEVSGTKYDMIVSNPPYVTREEGKSMHRNVTRFEPHIALFVENEHPLLFYQRIASFARTNLKSSGRLWFEVNAKYAEEVAALLESFSYDDVRIYTDLSGNDRFVRATR